MPHDWSMEVEDICDVQFLTDHHNRDGEALMRLDVARGNSLVEVEEMLREAIGMLEDGVPEDVMPSDRLVKEVASDITSRLKSLQPLASDSDDTFTVWVLLQWWEIEE